jgi:hypothetical protein
MTREFLHPICRKKTAPQVREDSRAKLKPTRCGNLQRQCREDLVRRRTDTREMTRTDT